MLAVHLFTFDLVACCLAGAAAAMLTNPLDMVKVFFTLLDGSCLNFRYLESVHDFLVPTVSVYAQVRMQVDRRGAHIYGYRNVLDGLCAHCDWLVQQCFDCSPVM